MTITAHNPINRSRIADGDGDPRHGTLNGYNNLKCRCATCRAANARYHADAMTARRNGPLPPHIRHGQYMTYHNYCCRCGPCRAANAAHGRATRARRRSA